MAMASRAAGRWGASGAPLRRRLGQERRQRQGGRAFSSQENFDPNDPSTWRQDSVKPKGNEDDSAGTLSQSDLAQLLSGASEPMAPQSLEGLMKGPQTAREAIDRGRELLQQGDAASAEELFAEAESLPGQGPTRVRGKEPELSEPERVAAKYNQACCAAIRQDSDAAIARLEEAVEAGFDDPGQMERDPDLEGIRSDERLATLVRRLRAERRAAPGPLRYLTALFRRQ